MVEYLYDVVKASAGEDIFICAQITDSNGADITQGCKLGLHNDNDLITFVDGEYLDGEWNFIIPAEVTKGLHGRYWYYIKYNDSTLCFKKPIYLC